MHPRRALVVASVAVLVAACGGGDDDTATPTPKPYEAETKRLASELCGLVATCSPTLYEINFGSDRAKCESREATTLLAGLSQPGVAAAPASVAACADAVRAGGCDALLRQLAANSPPDACRLPGKLADGAACSYPFQCASQSCDTGSPPQRCGVCVPQGGLGAACSRDVGCAFGLACIEKVCTAFVDVGGACDKTHPCFDWLRCDGTCKPQLDEGAPCKQVTGECDLSTKGLACISGACTKATFAAPGEDCGVVGGKAIACSAGACKPTQIKGTCFAYAKDGEACDPVFGADCELHAACIEGKCVSLFDQKCP